MFPTPLFRFEFATDAAGVAVISAGRSTHTQSLYLFIYRLKPSWKRLDKCIVFMTLLFTNVYLPQA